MFLAKKEKRNKISRKHPPKDWFEGGKKRARSAFRAGLGGWKVSIFRLISEYWGKKPEDFMGAICDQEEDSGVVGTCESVIGGKRRGGRLTRL